VKTLQKKMIKITAITVMLCVLSLTLASAPALACSQQQNRGFTSVIIQTGELSEKNGNFPPQIPTTFEAKSAGYPNSLFGVGIFTHVIPGSNLDSTIVLSGSIKDCTLKLSGCIVKSDEPELIGTKVKIVAEANGKLGDFSITLATPKDSTMFAGLTFVFTGKATILVK
jgi:hypothetical protein